MQITILNRQRKYPLDRERLLRWTGRVLQEQKLNGEVGLVFVNNRQIRGYNRDYRKRDAPTNVLAFPMQEGIGSGLHPEVIGDVMISLETVEKEALLYERSMQEHLLILLIHGLLHLLGYDHEVSVFEAARMRRREKRLFQIISDEGLLGG
ncbi:MAG: rRNA maturation RNase YbeY [Nitrospira sp.]